MRAHWKPVITVLLITPVLTELLSGNLPPSVFFRPQAFLFLATVGYGFPVLLLREFAVRRRLGLTGLLGLGFVYGIFNEGIIAKTLYLATNVPIRGFDGYGYAAGIAWPWAITVSTWHAFHSLLYPLVATYYFFPDQRNAPWFNRPGLVGLALPTILLGTLIFFTHSPEREAGHLLQFAIMIVAGALITGIALRLPAAPTLGHAHPLRWPAMVWGSTGYLVLTLVPVLLANAKIPVSAFMGYAAGLFALILCWLRKRASLPVTTVLLYAIGDAVVVALFGIGGALRHGAIQKLVASALFLAVFGWLITRLREDSRTGLRR